MSTVVETQSTGERRWLYITCWVVLGVLVLVALLTFRSARETAEAQEKASQLVAAIEDAGRTAPSEAVIARVLGDDGGATCADPNAALSRSALLAQLSNGATGPGARPVVVDDRVFQGQLLILEVYCPDELEEFQEFVDDLATSDVAG